MKNNIKGIPALALSFMLAFSVGAVSFNQAHPIFAAPPEEGDKRVWMKPTLEWLQDDDAVFYLHYWGGVEGSSWPGVEMNEEPTNSLFFCDIPEDNDNLIFNRVNPNNRSVVWNQSEDYEYLDSTSYFDITAKDGEWYDKGGEDWDNKLTGNWVSFVAQVVNGSFETENLAGWTPYRIWKNESGMEAWQDARVVSGTYFGTNPYNRDGSYNLGIVWPDASWEQSTERMGYLRSADFTLSGSGWISYRLGGGNNTSLAYLSIRKTSDNTEIARYGNKNYNNTTLATEQYGSSITNGEAFMFQYYSNLSDHLGESLYFTLSDITSYHWTILSADAFVTYYPVAPSPTPEGAYLATDIKPVIHGAGSAVNSISNELTANVNNWEDPNSIFRWDGGAGRTNAVGGDSARGVARSPAFTVNGSNTHLIWEWEGNIQYDKQLFVSIREVGTNIEVKRLVRRANLSGEEAGGGFDNHWTSLAALSTSKEYYGELVDNNTESWGIISIKDFRLRESDDDKVVVGDEAESVLNSNPFVGYLTNEDKAHNYAVYFLEQTGPYCELLDGGSVSWTSLGTVYADLSDDSKDYFVDADTDNQYIVDARLRYTFLINKYVNLASDPFMVDSDDNPYIASVSSVGLGYQMSLITNIVLMIYILFAVALLSGAVYIQKRSIKV